MADPAEPQPPGKDDPGWARYAGMGLELAGAIIGFTLLGYWIDAKFNTAPAGAGIGAALGIIGGMYNFFRQALRLTREQFGPLKKRGSDKPHDRTDRP
jgi:F0F1-type ATP synthase assembly protein I